MLRLFPSLIFLAFLLGVCLSCDTPKYDDAYFEEQNQNADCDNNCFWDSFPGGSCTNDPACVCTQQKYRERYFCCLGKQCAPAVLPQAVERLGVGCEQFNNPFTFDSEAVCGIKMASPCANPTVTVTVVDNSSQTSGTSSSVASTGSSITITGSPSAATTIASGASTGTSGTSSTQSASGAATSSTLPPNEAPLKRVAMDGLTFLAVTCALLFW